MNENPVKGTGGFLARAIGAKQKFCIPEYTINTNISVAENALAGFHSVVKRHNLEKAVIFVQQRNTYSLTFTHNIELEIFSHPEVTDIFWETMYFSKYDKNSWSTFSDDKMKSFLTLFSQSEQISTTSMIIKTFLHDNKNFILCILQSSATLSPSSYEEVGKSFLKLLPIMSNSQLSGKSAQQNFNIEEKISVALEKGFAAQLVLCNFEQVFNTYSEDLTEVDKYVIINSVFDRLCVFMGNHNICAIKKKDSLAIAFFTKEIFDYIVLFDIFKEKFPVFFSENSLEKLEICDDGRTESTEKIKFFLERLHN